MESSVNKLVTYMDKSPLNRQLLHDSSNIHQTLRVVQR